jgi:hypothetical protein
MLDTPDDKDRRYFRHTPAGKIEEEKHQDREKESKRYQENSSHDR